MSKSKCAVLACSSREDSVSFYSSIDEKRDILKNEDTDQQIRCKNSKKIETLKLISLIVLKVEV